MALAPSGAPVVLGTTAAPLLLLGGTVVRTGVNGFFLARLAPSLTGDPDWVSLFHATGSTGGVRPGRLSTDASGGILLAGSSNGNVQFGASTAITSSDLSRGSSWLWSLSPADGSTTAFHSWQANHGQSPVERARATSMGIGMAGSMFIGDTDFGGGAISCGNPSAGGPFVPFLVTFDPSFTNTMHRALAPTPTDPYHSIGGAADWTSCLDTVFAGVGINTQAPTTSVDFGAGGVDTPAGSLQLVEWDQSGALRSRAARPVDASYQVDDVAVSLREHSVLVAGHATHGFLDTLTPYRFAL